MVGKCTMLVPVNIKNFIGINKDCDLFEQDISILYDGKIIRCSPKNWKRKGRLLFGEGQQKEFISILDRPPLYDSMRINYFILNPQLIDKDPIDLEGFEDYVAVNDGNHRLIAAYMLGYKEIKAYYGGYVDTAIRLVGK